MLRTPLACYALPLLLLLTGCQRTQPRVVLYCAQDQEFAETVFDAFQKQSGLTIAPRYDTESTKSVSLYEDLLREANRPRCDVHWNNEILSTIRLRRAGLLEPHASPSAAPFPASAKAEDGTWHAFAARARVLLVNTKLIPEAEWPRSVLDLAEPKWKGKVALAKPQFGTTATHAACLFEVLGKDKAQDFFRRLRDNATVLSGNKAVAEAVGQGQIAVGLTDTDDAIAEVKAGKPVAIVFPDRDAPAGSRLGTLFIPNTVAIVKGCPNPAGARQLVDYLLSPEVEKRLAETASAQIPLNPQVQATLPTAIPRPGAVKAMDVNFEAAADLWDEVQAFLAKEFARP